MASTHADTIVKARVAVLFSEAELLAPLTFRQVMLGLGVEQKTLGQILRQDVSGGTLKDLLTMDVNPFGRRKPLEAKDLRLTHTVSLTGADITMLLRRYAQPGQDLLDFLVATEAVESRKADEIANRAETDEQVYKILIDERILTGKAIARIVDGPMNDRARLLRVQVASDILLHNDMIGPEDIAEVTAASEEEGGYPYEHLDRVISQEDLAARIEAGLFFPSIELTDESLPPGYADMFPVEMMERLEFLPLERDETHITLAVPDILDLSVPDTLAVLTGYSFSLVEGSRESMRAVMLGAMPDARLRGTNVPLVPSEEVGLLIAESGSRDVEEEIPESAVDLARRILDKAVEAGATDIHVERLTKAMRVRLRIDGVLHNALDVPEKMQDSLLARFKVLASMDVTERRRPQDGRFSLEDRAGRYDFRLATLPTQAGEKLVIRVLGTSTLLMGLDELGLLPVQRDIVRKCLDRSYGLILVTGPTGSGKTSTLYTMLGLLNSVERNIITIEDPVEYKLDGVAQVQVDPHIELHFAEGLRAALRQDPDIIMVGEIRDAETGKIAVRASLTGHLVFSTLHTNTAIGAVSTLRYLGVQTYLVASSLSLVVAQRLVRRVCSQCRQEVKPPASMLRDLGLAEDFKGKLAVGKGCTACYETGMRGRTGVYEVMDVPEELRRSIIEELSDAQMEVVARKLGYVNLQEAARQKVIDGVVCAEEALRECYLPI